MVIEYTKLAFVTTLPVILSVVLYELKKIHPEWDEHSIKYQVIVGMLFGLMSIAGTEFGIMVDGYNVNCRDAAPICAGLLFGGPAGIIAGLIGGVERWLCVYWGGGTFTRVACSLSTIIVGLAAGAIRKFMLDDRRPGWLLALFLGTTLEVFHLTMVFLTNMNQATEAMRVVKACTGPMIAANGLAVLAATMSITALSGKQIIVRDREKVHIVDVIQRWLLASILVSFAITLIFVYIMQNEMARRNASSLLTLSLTDMASDISEAGDDIEGRVMSAANYRHVGETGALVIASESGKSLSMPDEYRDLINDYIKIYNQDDVSEYYMYEVSAADQNYYVMYTKESGYYIVAILPESEAMEYRDLSSYLIAFAQLLLSALLFIMIYMLIKAVVVSGIYSTNEKLHEITEGNLDARVNVRRTKEFARLSDGINATVEALKQYINEANARIDQELQMAKDIQFAALPTFLPYGDNTSLFAKMKSAKEVGGDFYDFYFTEGNKLNLLIADVSGKGIPAALFMMRAKTQLKGLTETGHTLDKVFIMGNNSLCEGNDAEMFVTAWEGKVDLESGLLTYVNAGHNPPLLKRAGGKFEYIKGNIGLVLAAMEDMPYQTNEIRLEPGDQLFLYTDGVTEATNSALELYGEERLQAALNRKAFEDMEALCAYVKADVDRFVGDAPQFDDITMLAFRYDEPKEKN